MEEYTKHIYKSYFVLLSFHMKVGHCRLIAFICHGHGLEELTLLLNTFYEYLCFKQLT